MATRIDLTNVLHIRFEGRSFDVPLADVLSGDRDLGTSLGDADIKRSLARYLDVAEEKFRDYVIDRHETGNLTVRPEAVFG
jgi:hypothetical protein